MTSFLLTNNQFTNGGTKLIVLQYIFTDFCLCRPPASFHADIPSLHDNMSAVPGSVGGPCQQRHGPCGLVHVSLLSARCQGDASAVSPLKGTAPPAHVHQRAAGSGGEGLVSLSADVYHHCDDISSCKCSHRFRRLPLIGWAACGPLSIHCPSSKTTTSFCTTCPMWCTCPASLGIGWTGLIRATSGLLWESTWANMRRAIPHWPFAAWFDSTQGPPCKRTWSWICCTRWCLRWTPDSLREGRMCLWVTPMGWVNTMSTNVLTKERNRMRSMNWFVWVTSSLCNCSPDSSSLETLCAGDRARVRLGPHSPPQSEDGAQRGDEGQDSILS